MINLPAWSLAPRWCCHTPPLSRPTDGEAWHSWTAFVSVPVATPTPRSPSLSRWSIVRFVFNLLMRLRWTFSWITSCPERGERQGRRAFSRRSAFGWAGPTEPWLGSIRCWREGRFGRIRGCWSCFSLRVWAWLVPPPVLSSDWSVCCSHPRCALPIDRVLPWAVWCWTQPLSLLSRSQIQPHQPCASIPSPPPNSSSPAHD